MSNELPTTSSSGTTLKRRAEVAKDTIAVSPQIAAEHSADGATLNSVFVAEQLPPLDSAKRSNTRDSSNTKETKDRKDGHATLVEVINSDSFTLARRLMKEEEKAIGFTAVLNLASDEHPAGGWEYTLSKTQEEALCYSSTLFPTLKPSYYPWPNLGPGSVAGVFSPGVVMFRHDLDHNLVDLPLEERRVVSVITVAAPRGPALTPDGERFAKEEDLEDLRGKIRLVYRMAAHNGQRFLVLGAMGCGAYACPPRLVAQEMKSILLDHEFEGWFDRVVFAVYASPGSGARNFDVFREVFRDVML